jgi:hypothetical protein
MTQRSIPISIALGWVLGVVIHGLIYVITPWHEPGHAYPYWAMATAQIGSAVVAVLPGLAAGYLAGRSGFRVGAISGVLASLTMYALSATISWPSVLIASHVSAMFAVNALSTAVSAVITNGLTGIAGVYIRVLPSNPALNTDAEHPRRAG